MGGKSCESCRSWVDDIYWTHFQFVHFTLFLRPGYDQHLALPRIFSDNLKKKLPENVALKGPGGLVWKVGLTTRDDTLYLMHGWQRFVNDHSLEENDILVFKYNGESQFDVLIFDGESFCEKAASYFVRKCGHTEHGSGCMNTRKDTDNSLEEVNNPSNAGVECASPEESEHGNGTRVPSAVPPETPSKKTFNTGVEVEGASPVQFMDVDGVTAPEAVPCQTSGKEIRKLDSAVEHVQTKKRRGRPPKVSNPHVVVVTRVPDSEPASVDRNGKFEALYTSNRRPVTENEINNALQLAQAACTDDSLSIVMRPTHVYKGFYVSIPNKWITEHLSFRSQDVILRMVENEWLVKYSFRRARHTGGLAGGWRRFALDNNLEEFDVCVFKPTGRINNLLIMDVNIFRVIEEVVPLSRVNSGGIRGRKKLIRAIPT